MWRLQSAILVVTLVLAPIPCVAQVMKTIKDHATKQVDAQKKAADSTIVRAANKAVDSTLTKTGRPLDTLAERGSAIVDTTLNRSERVLSAGVSRLLGSSRSDQIATDLANGRVSLPEVRFVARTDALDSASILVLQRVATVLKNSSATYLVEGHVDSTGDVAAEMALSQRRALSVKVALASLGVPAERLFAMGYGATRPPTGESRPVARIEVARMQ